MNCKISLDEIEKKIRNFKSELACNSQKIRRKWIKFGISLRQHGLKSSKSADNYWLKQLSRLDVMIQLPVLCAFTGVFEAPAPPLPTSLVALAKEPMTRRWAEEEYIVLQKLFQKRRSHSPNKKHLRTTPRRPHRHDLHRSNTDEQIPPCLSGVQQSFRHHSFWRKSDNFFPQK